MADRCELFFFRHVGAGGNNHFFRADMKVVTGAGSFLHSFVAPPRCDVRFIGPLVIREAGVAIDAENAFSAGRTCESAKSIIASLILRMMASIGSRSSASNCCFRG